MKSDSYSSELIIDFQTDFENLHGKTALEKGSFALFLPRIVLGKKRKSGRKS